MIDIAEVVSKRKDELSISFQEIAKRSGLTDSSVKRIADGTTKNPKIGNLALISQALEMPFEKFLKELDRLRSSVKLSCNQLFLDVFKVVDHTLPGLVSTAD